MCWSIDKNRPLKGLKEYSRKTAKDITVYKIGDIKDNKFIPYYHYDFYYLSNKSNDEVKLKLEEIDDKIIIGDGYHSYSKDCYIYKVSDNEGIYIYNDKNESFDTYISIIRAKFIGKFIIPKGSVYYENEDGEIVSSQIIWTGESFPIINLPKSNSDIIFNKLNYVLEN